MAEPLIEFKGDIAVSGGLFDVNVQRQLARNMGRHVKHLVTLGEKTAKDRLAGSHTGSGYTERLIESYQKYDGSLFGKVRYKPEQTRQPGSPAYPATRRPYIIAAILETGRYGGGHVNRVSLGTRGRSRRYWQSGDRRRPGIFHMRYAARVVRAEAKRIRESLLTEGL